MFLLYAVIWGLLVPILTGVPSFAFAEGAPSSVEDTIRSLEDPFDPQVRAPALLEFFLKGLAEIQKQLEIQAIPVEEKVVPPVVVEPVVIKEPEPVKIKKIEIPQMKLTGIVYGTTRPQVIINGKVLSAGDVVDGVSILKIQKGHVDARFGDSDITIKMDNE